jgi:DNA-directed RNA polymerase subunit D
MIKIKNHDKERQKLQFVTDMPLSLANAIRRSALEIPVLAIDEVEIFKNDSALYDEIIAHRLGLIPLKTEKAIKTTKFRLKEKGPKTVFSTDLKPSTGISHKLPIVILDNEQELEILANAKLGKGIEHLKYSPGLVFYKHEVPEEILDFVHIGDDGKVNYDEEELKEKNIPEELMDKIRKLKEAKELEVNIESWGQMSTKDIFTKSIEVLEKNLNELGKAVK